MPIKITHRVFLLIFLLFAVIKAPALDSFALYSNPNHTLKKQGNAFGLLFNINKGDSLKFYEIRKKIRRNENNRIIGIIKKLTDTASIASLRKLNAELGTTQSANYESIILRIDSMVRSSELNGNDIDSLQVNTRKTKAEIEALDALVKKLIPIVTKRIETDGKVAARYKRYRLIQKLIDNQDSITDTITTIGAGDTIIKTISKLKLTRKANFFGYHPSWSNSKASRYKYRMINTLAFYAYQLEGATGKYKSIGDWETSEVVTNALNDNCKVVMVVLDKSASSIAALLESHAAQKKLAQNLVELLSTRNANGVNILFETTSGIKKDRFTRFMKYLNTTLKDADAAYELSLTLPAYDSTGVYDLPRLDSVVDKFVIDFTKMGKTKGPIAPLTGGKNSIKTGIEYLLKNNMLPEKIIACLPYRGVLWDAGRPNKLNYITYDTLRQEYPDYEPFYTDSSSSAILPIVFDDNDTVQKIWYDNEITLGKKYDYLLKNFVGGIGVWALGYDDKHDEFWNLLMDKIYTIDTIPLPPIKIAPIEDVERGFWASILHEFSLYKLIFNEPCKVDPADLKIDNLIAILTPVTALLIVLIGIFYIYMLRFEGDSWTWKKPVLRLLTILFVLTLIFGFMYIYLSDSIPIIGLTKDKDNCNSLPFKYILLFVGIGFLCGLAVMRFLIMPLMHDNKKP